MTIYVHVLSNMWNPFVYEQVFLICYVILFTLGQYMPLA